MATIAKIKTASGFKYKAHIKVDGKNVKIKTFTRKTDARTWAKRIEADHELMESLGCKGAGLALKELAKEYMAQWKGQDTNQVIRVNFWAETIGHYKVVDVTTDIVRKQLKELEQGQCKRGDGVGKVKLMDKTRSPATVNRYRSVLSAMFKYAIGEGYTVLNPVTKVPAKALDNQIVRYLSDNERNSLLSACKQSSWKHLHLVVLLGMTTGMRKAEMMNLKWSDIDFTRSVAMLATTKNGEPRHCPIPSIVMVELKKIRQVGDVLIFPSRLIPTQPIEFKKHWSKALKQANIADFRFHDLRHTAASYMVMNGMTLFEAATVLGHKDTQTTTRYAHLSVDHVSKATEKAMANVFNS